MKMFGSAVLAVLCSVMAVEAVLNFGDLYLPINKTADRMNWHTHPCKRHCRPGQEPMICKYVFVIEMWSVLNKACYDCPFNRTDCYRPHCVTAVGINKPIYTANRQIPGPPIEVCENDRVIVDVRNLMMSETVTIHWHGIKQTGTPFYDGVPYVNQCPILPNSYFQYDFEVTVAGTFFWHSHVGTQRADGLFGALISHPTESLEFNHHFGLYDYDIHHILINEWTKETANVEDIQNFQNRPVNVPATILINGEGRYLPINRTNNRPGSAYTPTAVFQVEKGKRYRMRLINAGSANCPLEFSVDGHVMQVISMDSKDIEPVDVDEITIWAGERVDFVLCANGTANNYWMRVRGLSLCAASNTSSGAFQVARLNYLGVPVDRDPQEPIGWELPSDSPETRVLNPFNLGTEVKNRSNVQVPELVARDPNDEAITRPVDHQIYIDFDFYPLDNKDYHRRGLYGYNEAQPDRRIGSLQLNHISLHMTPFPLQTQWQDIRPHMLCNEEDYPPGLNCTTDQCACTHVIPLQLNSVVELIFVDEGRYALINHPLHLHGHFFRVIASRNLGGNITRRDVMRLDQQGQIRRNLNHPPIKDTFKTPGGGYSIVRFYADNPGYWFFHCHFEDHMTIGMALIFKVGEHKQFPKTPKNFPTCNNYPDFTSRESERYSYGF